MSESVSIAVNRPKMIKNSCEGSSPVMRVESTVTTCDSTIVLAKTEEGASSQVSFLQLYDNG